MLLSDDAIENLVQPIIDRQQKVNNFILETIAERVNQIGHLTKADIKRMEKLVQSGVDIRKMNEYIAQATGKNVKDIKKLIREVAYNNYTNAKHLYDYRHKSYVPFNKNKRIQDVVKAVETQTAGTYKNISKSQAFMRRDKKNPKILKPTSISKTYQQVIDEAIQLVKLGGVNYETAIRHALRELIDSGIRVASYNTESGRVYSQRLDTAVRRNILDGVRAINQRIQDEIGRQVSSDGVELSAHGFSAPDHEPVQGRQFSNKQFERMQNGEKFIDVKGRLYEGFDRQIGTLNCRHYTKAIFIGVTKPKYTDKQLDAINEENHKGYTLPNGKHLTMYECTQHQRKLETAIRHAKDGQITARAANDPVLAREYQVKINKLVEEYKTFSDACGLTIQRKRMAVANYHKIST